MRGVRAAESCLMTTPEQEDQLERMLVRQIAARGIKDPHVLAAMAAVPRHAFVPETLQGAAYEDHPLPIGSGQTISQPYIVALMTELLEVSPEDRVLEIGTGSGYQAAILAHLAAEVYTLERRPELAARARQLLADQNHHNVHVICADGTLGYPDHAPYDAILVTAAGPKIPPGLLDQLSLGGRLLCPVGDRHVQRMIKMLRTEEGYQEMPGIDCVFVPLVGEEGWPEGVS